MAGAATTPAAAVAGLPLPVGWRGRFWNWWLHSVFQQSWMRLAIQVGVCTLLIMCIFSAPAVWELHQFDPILANPVLILVLANLGLLFSVNTGLPILKIGWESLVGSLVGGGCVYAVTYLVYAINGGSAQPGVLKAAMTMLFGAILLMLGTANRFRWQEHVALAGIYFNLTIAVGLSVSYVQQSRLWRFVLYWWWFVGLAFIFMVAVGMLVLPLPVGRVVRKQLAKALRQEGAVLEAIVQLLTADEAQPRHSKGSSSHGSLDVEAGGSGGGSPGTDSPDALPRAAPAHQQQQVQLGPTAADGVDEDGEPDFPVAQPSAADAFAEALQRRLRHALRRGSKALSRISSQLSFRAASVRAAKRAAEARAMGIHPDMFDAVEPIYAMSGPTAASIQAAFAHTHFTHLELDLYRPTRRFPTLGFHRMLLLARTLLSAAMMMVYPLQSGRARLGPSRQHAGQLQQAAAELKRCCQCLAAVLRSNAPVGPAIQQLAKLEEAFWELQRAVGTGAAAAAASPAGHEAAEQLAQQLIQAEKAAEAEAAEAEAADNDGPGVPPAEGAFRPQRQPAEPALPFADVGAEAAQDSLALHLSLSMLFTCCTRVRAMYLLLPQVVASDQQGVAEAVAHHFATAHAWEAVLRARTALEPQGASPRSSGEVFRRSQLLWGGASKGSMARSAAALGKLAKPAVQAAEPAMPDSLPGRLERAVGRVHRGLAAVEAVTGFTRDQLALGMQMAVAFVAVMFLVVVPAVSAALAHRSVWAVFIIVVVHEPLLGSVIWKCMLRFGGTLVAGLLGLGALYFTVLCNGLSFEDRPAKFIAMTVALTVLSMPLAAGTAYFGLRNAYFWIVSCLIMFTVALPGYAKDSPMPILALWRLACTAIGIAVELLAALLVFPVTARSAAHAVTAGALRGMAEVAGLAFHSVLPGKAGAAGAAGPASREGSRRGWRLSLDWRQHQEQHQEQQQHAGQAAAEHLQSIVEQQLAEQQLQAQPEQQHQAGQPQQQQAPETAPTEQAQQQQQQASEAAAADQAQQQVGQQHVVVRCPSAAGWQGNEVATGAVLRRIHKPMMETYGRITTLRALLVPLRVEYHPFKTPHRFPTGPGGRTQRLCRRMLNVLTTFAITMDSHHTQSVPLLEPHSAELEGLIEQLRQTLRALAAMVAGDVTLEGAARTVAALEAHAQHLMLRVLLSGPPPGLSTTDATQGLAFLAMLFNVTAVARLLCISLGEAFCPADTAGQEAAAALLRDASRWAGDDKLMAAAAELISKALVSTEDEH
ncbi:hypothetical protein ABPG75_013646 [Micractinium tetrahymenae]